MTRRTKLLLPLAALPILAAAWTFWSAGTPARQMQAAVGSAEFLGGQSTSNLDFPKESFYSANYVLPKLTPDETVARARERLTDSGWTESKVPVDRINPPGVTAFIHDGRSLLDPYHKRFPFMRSLFPHHSYMLRFYPAQQRPPHAVGGTGIDFVVNTSR